MSQVVVEVRDLKKHYQDTKAVDGVSFEIRSGEVFSLLGPNGAGKTTTVEILEGLRNPTSGEARVLGADVQRDYDTVRDRVGALPQDFEPFDRLRPPEAVEYWANLVNNALGPHEIAALLDRVGLASRSRTYALNLSGGEKRRLGIAMALVGDPELVFLDEPTTGLDPGGRRDLWTLIQELQRGGKTVLLTTHYLDEAEHLADEVAIMNHGKIVAQGSPKDLISNEGGGTTIVLAGAGAIGQEALARRGIEATLEGNDVLVYIPRVSEVRLMLSKLAAIDMPLMEIYTRRASLEDVFLKLVGARMREGELAK